MASSTPNDDWFQSAASAQIRSERFERAELLNGRAAMIGFVVGVLTEALTGQGIASQITLACSAATESMRPLGQNVPLKSRVPHPIGRRQALTDPIFRLNA